MEGDDTPYIPDVTEYPAKLHEPLLQAIQDQGAIG